MIDSELVKILIMIQGGDDHLIVEYGNEQFDLNHRSVSSSLNGRLTNS